MSKMKTRIKAYNNKSALHTKIKKAFEKSENRQRRYHQQMLKSSIAR